MGFRMGTASTKDSPHSKWRLCPAPRAPCRQTSESLLQRHYDIGSWREFQSMSHGAHTHCCCSCPAIGGEPPGRVRLARPQSIAATSTAGHHHAGSRRQRIVQGCVAAAVIAAGTAECSDGPPVVADEDCSSGRAARRLSWRTSTLAWHRPAEMQDLRRHVSRVPRCESRSFAALPADVWAAVLSHREVGVFLPEQCQCLAERLQSAASQHDGCASAGRERRAHQRACGHDAEQ